MNNEPDLDCSICLEEFAMPIPNCRGDKYKEILLACQHKFHERCLLKYTSANETRLCPICRADLSALSIHVIKFQVSKNNCIAYCQTLDQPSLLYALQEATRIHRIYYGEFSYDETTDSYILETRNWTHTCKYETEKSWSMFFFIRKSNIHPRVATMRNEIIIIVIIVILFCSSRESFRGRTMYAGISQDSRSWDSADRYPNIPEIRWCNFIYLFIF